MRLHSSRWYPSPKVWCEKKKVLEKRKFREELSAPSKLKANGFFSSQLRVEKRGVRKVFCCCLLLK